MLLGILLYMRCRSFSLSALIACIDNYKCVNCDNFGDMFYLITAERVCYPCLRFGRPARCALFTPRDDPELREEAIKLGFHMPFFLAETTAIKETGSCSGLVWPLTAWLSSKSSACPTKKPKVQYTRPKILGGRIF